MKKIKSASLLLSMFVGAVSQVSVHAACEEIPSLTNKNELSNILENKTDNTEDKDSKNSSSESKSDKSASGNDNIKNIKETQKNLNSNETYTKKNIDENENTSKNDVEKVVNNKKNTTDETLYDYENMYDEIEQAEAAVNNNKDFFKNFPATVSGISFFSVLYLGIKMLVSKKNKGKEDSNKPEQKKLIDSNLSSQSGEEEYASKFSSLLNKGMSVLDSPELLTGWQLARNIIYDNSTFLSDVLPFLPGVLEIAIEMFLSIISASNFTPELFLRAAMTLVKLFFPFLDIILQAVTSNVSNILSASLVRYFANMKLGSGFVETFENFAYIFSYVNLFLPSVLFIIGVYNTYQSYKKIKADDNTGKNELQMVNEALKDHRYCGGGVASFIIYSIKKGGSSLLNKFKNN